MQLIFIVCNWTYKHWTPHCESTEHHPANSPSRFHRIIQSNSCVYRRKVRGRRGVAFFSFSSLIFNKVQPARTLERTVGNGLAAVATEEPWFCLSKLATIRETGWSRLCFSKLMHAPGFSSSTSRSGDRERLDKTQASLLPPWRHDAWNVTRKPPPRRPATIGNVCSRNENGKFNCLPRYYLQINLNRTQTHQRRLSYRNNTLVI